MIMDDLPQSRNYWMMMKQGFDLATLLDSDYIQDMIIGLVKKFLSLLT